MLPPQRRRIGVSVKHLTGNIICPKDACQSLWSIYHCLFGKAGGWMANLRDILANNLRENRKKCGLSQAKLSEKASISTQYIAMIEVSRKFPTPEVLERIAKALEIEAHELFSVRPSLESEMQRLHDTLAGNIERLITEAVEKTLAGKCQR
jgi:transcriptional regulator with XRE-family HTH domain